MLCVRRFLVGLLAFALVAQGQGNTFNKVRYNGGSVDSKVDPKDWDNRLTVTSDTITLALKDGKKVDIPAKSVTSLSYGQEAHRRVGTMIALAILVAPVALFGLFHKTRLHYIGIQYATPEGKAAGILLQGDKDNYRAILVALQGVTGVAVSVCGVVGFVGIVVPHLLRLLIGPAHRLLLPASMLLGAVLLVGADTLARTIVAPAEMPIGILTAAIGAPFFLGMLLRQRGLVSL